MSESSVSVTYISSPTSPSTSALTDDNLEQLPMKQPGRKLQPNLTRKSHTKSRKGCFTCKARKIKCGEEKPHCKNCQSKANDCTYPLPETRHGHGIIKRSNSICTSLSSAPCSFSHQDFQFFHHFLTLAYPHLPLGNDHVWIKDIPQFASQHSYLLHAMLALGASHLGCISPKNNYQAQSLQHRCIAMTGFNKALAKPKLAYGEADAMLATCYALTFQSTFMPDGLKEFITFVRGCALTTEKVRGQQAETAFNIQPDRHFEIVRSRLRHLPSINPIHILCGLESLETLKPFLRAKADIDFYQALHGIYRAFTGSSPEGYIKFVQVFAIWYDMSPEDFNTLLDPDNVTAQILFAYFIATELIVVPLSANDMPDRMLGPIQTQTLMGLVSWAQKIFDKVPAELQYHLEWPKCIVLTVTAEISRMPHRGPAVLVDLKAQHCSDDGGRSDHKTQSPSPIAV